MKWPKRCSKACKYKLSNKTEQKKGWDGDLHPLAAIVLEPAGYVLMGGVKCK